MITILEEYLTSGIIHIAASSGFLFYATYEGSDKKTCVSSDRGLPHLFMLLAAAISGNDALKAEADNKYKYPLSMRSEGFQERKIRHAYVRISKVETTIFVRIEGVACKFIRSEIPGLSRQESAGGTIEEALKNALDAKPHRFISYP